jgi:TonB family protein
VRERHLLLQFCYESARAAQPGLAGTATVSLLLDDQGGVQDALVERRSWSGDGSAVEDCVLAKVRRWRFPTAEEPEASSQTFTLIFSPPAPLVHRTAGDGQ